MSGNTVGVRDQPGAHHQILVVNTDRGDAPSGVLVDPGTGLPVNPATAEGQASAEAILDQVATAAGAPGDAIGANTLVGLVKQVANLLDALNASVTADAGAGPGAVAALGDVNNLLDTLIQNLGAPTDAPLAVPGVGTAIQQLKNISTALADTNDLLNDGTLHARLESIITALDDVLAAVTANSTVTVTGLSDLTTVAEEIRDRTLTAATDTVTVEGEVSLDAATVTALRSIAATVEGTVGLDVATLNALATVTAVIDGAVELDGAQVALLRDVTAAVTGTVGLTGDALTALDAIVTALGGTLTVTGTVDLPEATVTALKAVTAVIDGPFELTAAQVEALQTVTATVTGDALTRLTDIATALAGPLAVTGPLTDAELRATPVPVSDANTTTLVAQNATFVYQPGVEVVATDTAALRLAANPARRMLLVQHLFGGPVRIGVDDSLDTVSGMVWLLDEGATTYLVTTQPIWMIRAGTADGTVNLVEML